MMIFIISVFVLGALSIIYVLFPPTSIAKGFKILKHIYISRKIKKKSMKV